MNFYGNSGEQSRFISGFGSTHDIKKKKPNRLSERFEMTISHNKFDPCYLRHVSIDADKKKRQAGVWQLDTSGEKPTVYVTCPDNACKAINNIADHGIDDRGYGSPCFVCNKCQSHNFFYLQDWPKVTAKAGVTWEKKVERDGWRYEDAIVEWRSELPDLHAEAGDAAKKESAPLENKKRRWWEFGVGWLGEKHT